MKLAKITAAALILCAAPAFANEQVVAGATVTGPEGNPVGTIESVANGQAILDTGKHKVPLGIEMYGEGESGPTISVTKAQLDAIMDEQIAAAEAQRDAALIVGAPVVSARGLPVGTISEHDEAADTFIVETETGPVTMQRGHFSVDANGALMALFTLDQIANVAGSAEAAR